jgi:hypothetical protein
VHALLEEGVVERVEQSRSTIRVQNRRLSVWRNVVLVTTAVVGLAIAAGK